MRELLTQFGTLNAEVRALLDDPRSRHSGDRPQGHGDAAASARPRPPISACRWAARLIPWIDKDLGIGKQPSEPADVQKSGRAARKPTRSWARAPAFGTPAIPVDGFCVRVGAMRCHSQALTFKLKKDVPMADIEGMIAADNPWVESGAQQPRSHAGRDLTPVAVTGTLTIPVGRIRKLAMGPEYVGAFTIGDQLLWGAAEPLRRMLRILLEA
jgi:aspartate-semialdehyde dehydrogenase